MSEVEKITNGPDKWDLISSFANREFVDFEIPESQSVHGLISSIEHENGSGSSFNIEFQINGMGIMRKVNYNTKSKKGSMSKR
jgi:hypothetical protein